MLQSGCCTTGSPNVSIFASNPASYQYAWLSFLSITRSVRHWSFSNTCRMPFLFIIRRDILMESDARMYNGAFTLQPNMLPDVRRMKIRLYPGLFCSVRGIIGSVRGTSVCIREAKSSGSGFLRCLKNQSRTEPNKLSGAHPARVRLTIGCNRVQFVCIRSSSGANPGRIRTRLNHESATDAPRQFPDMPRTCPECAPNPAG